MYIVIKRVIMRQKLHKIKTVDLLYNMYNKNY